MSTYKLVVDSAGDLTFDFCEKNGIGYVPLSVTFDDEKHFVEHFELKVEDLFDKMQEEENFPKTACPPIATFMDTFEEILKEGKDILYLAITSELSGTYQSAVNAKNMLLEDYPDRKIEIIDTRAVSSAVGVLSLKALENFKNGMSLEDNTSFINSKIDDVLMLFTAEDLNHLLKGGRLKPSAATIGNLLNLKPILKISNHKIEAVHKARKEKKVFQYLIDNIRECEKENPEGVEVYLVSTLNNPSLEALRETLKNENISIQNSFTLSAIPLVHAGPKSVGIVIYKK